MKRLLLSGLVATALFGAVTGGASAAFLCPVTGAGTTTAPGLDGEHNKLEAGGLYDNNGTFVPSDKPGEKANPNAYNEYGTPGDPGGDGGFNDPGSPGFTPIWDDSE